MCVCVCEMVCGKTSLKFAKTQQPDDRPNKPHTLPYQPQSQSQSAARAENELEKGENQKNKFKIKKNAQMAKSIIRHKYPALTLLVSTRERGERKVVTR